ncbi:hypothetical protein ACOMHN_020771 [Nucella lapillus]
MKHEKSQAHYASLVRNAVEEFQRKTSGIEAKLNRILASRKLAEEGRQQTFSPIHSHRDLHYAGAVYLATVARTLVNLRRSSSTVGDSNEVKAMCIFFPTGVATITGVQSSAAEGGGADAVTGGDKRKSCPQQSAELSYKTQPIWCNDDFWETLQLLHKEKHQLFKLACQRIFKNGYVNRDIFDNEADSSEASALLRDLLSDDIVLYGRADPVAKRELRELDIQKYCLHHAPVSDCALVSPHRRTYSATIRGRKRTFQVVVIEEWECMEQFDTVCGFQSFLFGTETRKPTKKATPSLSTVVEQNESKSEELEQSDYTETEEDTDKQSQRKTTKPSSKGAPTKQPPTTEKQNQPSSVPEQTETQTVNQASEDTAEHQQTTVGLSIDCEQRKRKEEAKTESGTPCEKELPNKWLKTQKPDFREKSKELQDENHPGQPFAEDAEEIHPNELQKEETTKHTAAPTKMSDQYPEVQMKSKQDQTNMATAAEMLKQTDNASHEQTLCGQLEEEQPTSAQTQFLEKQTDKQTEGQAKKEVDGKEKTTFDGMCDKFKQLENTDQPKMSSNNTNSSNDVNEYQTSCPTTSSTDLLNDIVADMQSIRQDLNSLRQDAAKHYQNAVEYRQMMDEGFDNLQANRDKCS